MTAVSSATSTSVSSVAASPPASDEAQRQRPWRQGLFTFADQAVVSLVNALTTIIVGRACSKEELGIFAFGIAILWRASGIPMALVWSPYASRAPHLKPARLAGYAGSAAVQVVVLGLLQAVVLALAFVVSLVLAAVMNVPGWVPPLLLALGPLLLGVTLREHARRTSIADFRGEALLAIDIPIGLVQLGVLAWLWHNGWLTYATALWTVAASCGLSLVWFVLRSSSWSIRRRRVKAHFLSNLQFGSWLLGIAVAWLVCDLLLRVLLAWFHGIEEVGTYQAAFLIVSLTNPLVLAATNFSRSLAARVLAVRGIDGLRSGALRATIPVAALALLLSGFLAAYGDQIVLWIFNKPYADKLVVGAVALGFCLQAVAIPVEAAQMALQRGRHLFVVSVLRLVVVVVCGVPLVWWQGAAGIGWTVALQSIAVLILH